MAYAVPFLEWQYLSMRVAAKTAYTSLRILLVYECNANVVYFDGVQLFTASGQRIRFNNPGMYYAFFATKPAGWKFGLMQGVGVAYFIF